MIPSSFFESYPKNVCPSCGERAKKLAKEGEVE